MAGKSSLYSENAQRLAKFYNNINQEVINKAAVEEEEDYRVNIFTKIFLLFLTIFAVMSLSGCEDYYPSNAPRQTAAARRAGEPVPERSEGSMAKKKNKAQKKCSFQKTNKRQMRSCLMDSIK